MIGIVKQRAKEYPLLFWVQTILILAALTGIVWYAWIKAKPLVSGPQIQITQPQTGDIIKQSTIDIQGTAKNAREIYINGLKTDILSDTSWKQTITLMPGYNSILVEARDRFKNKQITSVEIYRENETNRILKTTPHHTEDIDGTE